MQVEAFFKKNNVFSTDECEQNAIKAFFKAEKLCAITNRRLDWYYLKRDRLDPDLQLYMRRVERRISNVLGPIEPFIDALPRLIRVTAGATASSSRRNSLPALKLSLKPACSSGAVPLIHALYRYFGFEQVRPNITNTNRIEIVPKNFTTGRTIAAEAEGNTALQLAADEYGKGRLRLKTGVNLSSQVQNQREALKGSLDGDIATLDLVQASDTAAYNAVAWVFPYDWFKYLDSIRSKQGNVPTFAGGKRTKDRTTITYNKFSSMGNGSTFVIETLIFEACCYAVGSRKHAVYGDDITIESKFVEPVTKLLRFLGFNLNVAKSFVTGPFRESCGKNYYSGVDITPFYLREIDGRKTVLSHMVNGLAAIAMPEGRLWSRLRDIVEERRLPFIPLVEDTMGGVHVDVPSAYSLGLIKKGKQKSRKRPNPGVLYFRSYLPKGKRRSFYRSQGLYLWFLQKNFKRYTTPLVEVSWATTSVHKYVRKWVRWTIPTVGTPVHIFMWTDYLLRKR
jgi:hypothetical protein